ncbi:MAG: DUF192 domain-containing protein [Celeribacter sp.]|jgi:uncharacterized membrane protein (UPF0127 family)
MRKAGVTLGSVMWVMLLVSPALAAPVCDPDQVDLRGEFGTARFNVAVADDPQKRAQGLMHVERMARSTGMIFLYPEPQPASFWMKNTLIPLDMIFVGADGVIRTVHENAVPQDLTPIPGGDDIVAVLEINGGLSRALGLEAGDEMRHPAFGSDAVWACPEGETQSLPEN